ncbi:MAG: hypothetical protein J6T23_04615 [Elusimicrobia bacterium]|nr:hypothetical protein [Elusimicrobiota bacterium]
MKMKKILSLTLSLTMVFMLNIPVQSETEPARYLALAEFDDYNPDLIHDEPRVEEVISCNMVVKPKTEVHLSRLCESAVTNVKYYFNEDEANIQKGPDCTVEADGIFYPGTRVIPNSYIGGTVNYRVSGDFQTKKTDGEIVHLEVPVGSYQPVEIIDSKTLYLDMGEEYTLYQPTGDQSQPDWVGVKQAYPTLSGRYINWTFRFGSIANSGSASGAFGLFKAKTQSECFRTGIGLTAQDILTIFNAEELESAGFTCVTDENGGTVVYPNMAVKEPVGDADIDLCRKATKFIMQYNLNLEAYDTTTREITTEEGWMEIDDSQKPLLSVHENEDGKLILSYPDVANAWTRIIAVIEIPEEGYRPAKRVRVKSRISTYGGFKFGNLKEGDVVKIYNVSGKKVAELNAGTADGFEWLGREGTNNSGDWAKSGIYIYQIKLKDKSKLVSGTISFVW